MQKVGFTVENTTMNVLTLKHGVKSGVKQNDQGCNLREWNVLEMVPIKNPVIINMIPRKNNNMDMSYEIYTLLNAG